MVGRKRAWARDFIRKDDLKMNIKSGIKDCKTDMNNKKSEFYDLKFYLNNIRGIMSKQDTLLNIFIDEKVDVGIITETHTTRNKFINLPGYSCYYRNREGREKGGVCIYIHEKFKNACMKLESGIENNEFFVVKLECFTPNVVIIGYYGVIECQYSNEEVLAMQADIFSIFNKYREEGNTVIWAGDFNNHLKELEPDNKESVGGRNLQQFIDDEDLDVLNKDDLKPTHIDRSNGMDRILDLVITNNKNKCKEFKVDWNLSITPYRIKVNKGKHNKVFSDHLGIKWILEVERNKSISNKVTQWNFNKPYGNDKYEQITNDMADEIEMLLLQSDDIEMLYNSILEYVEEAKTQAYGKITRTKTQLKKKTDSQIWRQRTKDIEKAVLGLKKHKVNDRIWEVRNTISDKFADKQFVGVKDPNTGEMTKDREETFKVTLDYNYDLLRKDTETEVSDVTKEKRRLKEIAVELALKDEGFKEDEELEYKDFEKVMEKIKRVNKNVYRDLIKAGDKFKTAVFHFYEKCYKLERMPGDFYYTELQRLYKGKGNRLEMKANRFLHMKGWGPKVYEKMLMTKMESKMFHNTPNFQVGGQKMGSTNEHLASMITGMRRLEKEQGGGSVIFMDIKSCFDKVRLNDILFETAQCGVIGRPLRNIKEYTDNLIIKIQGDPDKSRERKIFNSTGQGSGFAPVGTSLVMAKTLKINMDKYTGNELIGNVKGVKMNPNYFVDDLAKNCVTALEAKANGEVITETLDELGLSAHPDKSGILVYGKNREKLITDILKDPTEVQKFKLNFKEKETYLGMVFSKGGAADSINQTIESRKVKCLIKAADIKRKVNDERLMGVGWLAGATLIHSAVIVSTLTYGSAALTGMTKANWDQLESIQLQCLTHILGITNRITYQSLLYVLGLMPVKDVIKKLQIGFINNLFHIKNSGQCMETLKADHNIGDIKGLVGEVREYCTEYGLEDVTKVYMHPETIKNKIDRVVLDRQWLTHLRAKKPPPMVRRDDRKNRFYQCLPMNQAKLMLLYECGELNFRKGRKQEALRRYGNFKCLVPMCSGDDELSHVRECTGYTSRLKDDAGPYDIINYLSELEYERLSKFRRSLVNCKTL